MRRILLTAAKEDAEEFVEWVAGHDLELLHFPLERYVPRERDDTVAKVFEELEDFENIVFGSRRNALFFLGRAKELGKMDAVRNRLNLAVDESTARYLENEGVPAVRPPGDPGPIDLVEFMLRLRRLGPTLYPRGSHAPEDFPGFLEELDIAVREVELFDLEGPAEEKLEAYRAELETAEINAVIFHSRRSVTRIAAAFPGLDLSRPAILSADTAITQKLEQQGIAVDREAAGSWASLYETLLEL